MPSLRVLTIDFDHIPLIRVLQERKAKVRSYLDNLSKENKALQESNASLEITARDALAAKAYIEQHRNQLESALVAAKDQVGGGVACKCTKLLPIVGYSYAILRLGAVFAGGAGAGSAHEGVAQPRERLPQPAEREGCRDPALAAAGGIGLAV